MSKANSAIKVLKTAIKRVDKGWTRGSWSKPTSDGGRAVCLEGAIFGYCMDAQTDEQREAHAAVLEVIQDRFPDSSFALTIPGTNDRKIKDKEEAKELLKLAIIHLETQPGQESGDETEDEESSLPWEDLNALEIEIADDVSTLARNKQ